MKAINIEILHSLLLDIGKEFHKICVENNIPYYMLGGTQLGTIRHKGFIPWDDDMDFGVPREYFDKCISCLRQYLPRRYKLLTMDNSDYVVGFLVKIIDTHTKADYHFINSTEEYGVNIDIFPLDRTNGSISIFSRNWLIQLLLQIDSYRLFSLDELSWGKRMSSKIIKTILFPLKRSAICDFIKNHLIKGGGDFIANYSGKWKFKEIVPMEFFGEPREYKFESVVFFGVADYESYLSAIYGNWQQLPPKDKQHFHLNNIFIK